MPDQTNLHHSEPPLGIADRLRIQTWALFIIAFAALVWMLAAGRFILMSLALSVIVFSLTLGMINHVSRVRIWGLGVPRWLSYMIAILTITGGLIFASLILVSTVNRLIVAMILYSEVATQGLGRLFEWMGEERSREILTAIRSINVNSYLRSLALQLSNLVSVAVMTSLFAGFLFAEQLWFQPKLRALYPDPARAEMAERIFASIIERVNRYLLVKTAVSLGVGVIVYLTMRGFGLQFAAAMGILSFVLNYIPNLGTLTATAIAVLAAFVQQPDWATMIAFTLIICLVQFVSGNILEPVLMGRKLALSTLGIVFALTFWGSVWGVMGMFLAVPINVAMMVAFSYIKPLRPFAVLLSRDGLIDTEALPPHEQSALPQAAE